MARILHSPGTDPAGVVIMRIRRVVAAALMLHGKRMASPYLYAKLDVLDAQLEEVEELVRALVDGYGKEEHESSRVMDARQEAGATEAMLV